MSPEQIQIPEFVINLVGTLQLQLAAAQQTIAQLEAKIAEKQDYPDA